MKNHGLSAEGFGRPVLHETTSKFETLPGSGMMIIVPVDMFFGASTYFRGVDTFSSSCGAMEYDATKKGDQTYKFSRLHFIDADNDTLKEHLKSDKVSQYFRELASELIEQIEY